MPELKIGDEIKVYKYPYPDQFLLTEYKDGTVLNTGTAVYTVEIKKIERVKLTLEE